MNYLTEKLMLFLGHKAATFREGCRASSIVCILSRLEGEAGGKWRQLGKRAS